MKSSQQQQKTINIPTRNSSSIRRNHSSDSDSDENNDPHPHLYQYNNNNSNGLKFSRNHNYSNQIMDNQKSSTTTTLSSSLNSSLFKQQQQQYNTKQPQQQYKLIPSLTTTTAPSNKTIQQKTTRSASITTNTTRKPSSPSSFIQPPPLLSNSINNSYNIHNHIHNHNNINVLKDSEKIVLDFVQGFEKQQSLKSASSASNSSDKLSDDEDPYLILSSSFNQSGWEQGYSKLEQEIYSPTIYSNNNNNNLNSNNNSNNLNDQYSQSFHSISEISKNKQNKRNWFRFMKMESDSFDDEDDEYSDEDDDDTNTNNNININNNSNNDSKKQQQLVVDKKEILLLFLLQHAANQLNPDMGFFISLCKHLTHLGYFSNRMTDESFIKTLCKDFMKDISNIFPITSNNISTFDNLDYYSNNNNNYSNNNSNRGIIRSESYSSYLSDISNSPSNNYHESSSSSSPIIDSMFYNTKRLESDYHHFQKLGKEKPYSSVIKAHHKIDGRAYAIKKVKFHFSNTFELEHVYSYVVNEIKNLAKLDNENIIRYNSAWFEPYSSSHSSNINNNNNTSNNTLPSSDSSSSSNSTTTNEKNVSTSSSLLLTTASTCSTHLECSSPIWSDSYVNSLNILENENEEQSLPYYQYNNNIYNNNNYNNNNNNNNTTTNTKNNMTNKNTNKNNNNNTSSNSNDKDVGFEFTPKRKSPIDTIIPSPPPSMSYFEFALKNRKDSTCNSSTCNENNNNSSNNNNSNSNNNNSNNIIDNNTRDITSNVKSILHEMFNVNNHFEMVLYIVMQLCEGITLENWLLQSEKKKNRKTNLIEILKIFKRIVKGVCHIHERGLVHKNLKPNNIFITLNNRIKIADFGVARYLQECLLNHKIINKKDQSNNNSNNRKKSQQNRFSEQGSLYASPEQIFNQKFDQKGDIYSLGVILFELISPSFITTTERVHVLSQLKKREISEEILKSFPREIEIIKQCLEKPNNRPTAQELLQKVTRLIKSYKIEGRFSSNGNNSSGNSNGNNSGMFKHSNSSNSLQFPSFDTIREKNKIIEEQQRQIELLKEQLRNK